MKRIRIIVAACVLMLLCAGTWIRGITYSDEAALWGDVAAKSPSKARVHNNLGHALKEKGNIREAMLHFERAIELNPDYPDALNNLATIYGNIGRENDALQLLNRALELNPDYVPARHNLALRYYEKGLLNEAIREYNLIIELNPYSKEAAFARQMLLLIRKQNKKENRVSFPAS